MEPGGSSPRGAGVVHGFGECDHRSIALTGARCSVHVVRFRCIHPCAWPLGLFPIQDDLVHGFPAHAHTCTAGSCRAGCRRFREAVRTSCRGVPCSPAALVSPRAHRSETTIAPLDCVSQHGMGQWDMSMGGHRASRLAHAPDLDDTADRPLVAAQDGDLAGLRPTQQWLAGRWRPLRPGTKPWPQLGGDGMGDWGGCIRPCFLFCCYRGTCAARCHARRSVY